MNFFSKLQSKKSAGFTLVELLVSMAVFGILMSLAIGVFVSAMKAERSLADLMSTNNNLNLVIEQMAREIRMGYFDKNEFDSIRGSVNTGACMSSLSFHTMQTNDAKEEGTPVTYSFLNESLTKDGALITGENVKVERACFSIYQYDMNSNRSTDLLNNCNPWRITIAFAVKPKNAKDDVDPTYVETSVSMRIFPIDIKDDPFQCRKPE